MIEAANETAAGQYQYLSIIWKGKAVDLNGDGVLNRDIIKEYEGSINCEKILKSEKSGIVYPIEAFGRQQIILIDFPKQSLFCFNKEKYDKFFIECTDIIKAEKAYLEKKEREKEIERGNV